MIVQVHDGCELISEGLGDECVAVVTVEWDLFLSLMDVGTPGEICEILILAC